MGEGGGRRVREKPFEGEGGRNVEGLAEAPGEETVADGGGVRDVGQGFGKKRLESAGAAASLAVPGADGHDGVGGGQVYEFGSNDERLAD